MFKIDFHEYYALLERAIVHLYPSAKKGSFHRSLATIFINRDNSSAGGSKRPSCD
jgi:hypothetical protein